MKNLEYVILDVETTGLSHYNGDRIVEIAALKIKNLQPVGEFHSLINPQREISWGAFLVNKITREMVEDAPVAKEILPNFLDFLGDACLVGHNVKFDLGFINHELSFIDRTINEESKIFDTMRMARKLISGLMSYRLISVANALGINMHQEHRAMADVQLTFEIFVKLIKLAEEQKINNFEKFVIR